MLYSEKLVKDARTLYDLKLRIISQSLYGVDIDPFATNIAKLRLWLSLAVEADEPVPLPNLDFKIETGDSLLAPDPQDMPNLFRGLLQASADNLANVKRQYFLAHGDEKDSFRRTISQGGETAERSTARAAWGRCGGLADSVRGGVRRSSPWLRRPSREPALCEKGEHRQDREAHLRDLYDEAVTGQSDLFCYFYVRALQLLRPWRDARLRLFQ